MAREKAVGGSVKWTSLRDGWRSTRRWFGLLATLASVACASAPTTSDETSSNVGVESAAVTAPACSDIPAEYVGAADGCDCPANGSTSCDSDCTQFGNPGGEWCGCEYCYEPAGSSELCSLVPSEYLGANDGCDCPSDGSESCDPDCTEQGNPGGAYCGCQYCYPEDEPPPTGGVCDFVPNEYIGVHDGCDCPADGNTSCDPDCAEGNLADDYCGCQFCYGGSNPPPSTGADPYAIDIPNRMSPQMVTLLARNSLNIGADAQVRRGPRGLGRVVNTGAQSTAFGARSRVGETWSSCPVSVGNNAEVGGTVYSPGPVSQGSGSSLPGGVETVPVLPDSTVHTWNPHLPPRTGGDKNVTGGTTLAPGGYGNVTVSGSGVLRLGPGIYHIGDLNVGPTGKVIIDDANGPVIIYVSGGVQFDGTIVNTNNQADPGLEVLIVVTGNGVVRLGGFFTGTVYAPRSPVSLTKPGNPGYHGSYFGNDVTLSPGVFVWHVAFPWSGVQPDSPNAPKTWGDSSIRLGAWFDHVTGQSHPEETTLEDPVNFTIPPVLYVRSGNAGTGTARLRFRNGGAPITTCTYKGAAGVANPTTPAQRMRGMIYEFQNCSDGAVAGQRVLVDWVALEVVSGNANDPSKRTEVSLDSGDGCSAYIPPPLHPWEVVDLKTGFSWRTIKALPETDPDGRPALWHGLIYISDKAQLAALDRLRVFWSARPLSATYTESMRGLCGRVEHATDGTGVVVYAVFPAKLFNLIRAVSARAVIEGIAPPFAFIIPSTPEAEYANSDGSLRYDALASTGFHLWLAERSALSPGFWSKITKPFRQAAKWVNDNVINPLSTAGETIVHWTVDGLDELIDALVPVVDDIWETTQEALGLLAYAIEDDVGVHLDVRLENLDPNFPAGSYLVRAWGAPCTTTQQNQGICAGEQPTSGTRPILLPTGTKFRIRQWGFGFLPIMKEKKLGSNGQIDLRAIKNRTGRGGDFCIQLEAEYGMITTDFIPNEVCDFATNRYGDFESEVNDTLVIRHEDLHSFAQVKDGFDYNRSVLGRESFAADILTGWPANGLTSLLNGGDPRAMTLCLDFPGGPAALTTIVGVLTLGVGDKLYSKDIWWPDSAGARYARRSRVMTHEYGHFTMCDLLYASDGAGGVTGLLARLSDGEATRADETGVMTEAIADLYSLQVAGATDYVASDNSTLTSMNYCNGPLCYDFNYRGANDSRPSPGRTQTPYLDEIARWVSLTYDAFDQVGHAAHASSTAVSNSDFWRDDPSVSGTQLLYTPTGYLGRDDEPVALTGRDWQTWVQKWLGRGRPPFFNNVIGGLFDTVRVRHNWCGACELMAAHHPNATANIAMTAAGATRTPLVQVERLDFCLARPEMNAWLGTPPRADGRFDTSCNACLASQFVDNTGGTYTGQCRPCSAGQIATRHGCTACPAGTVPTANNDCRRCAANQISSGNSCVTCPFGQAADAATNTCVFCEPDAVVDWATTALCGQTVMKHVNANGVSGDHCPNDAWLEVRNIASGPIASNYTTFRAENYFSPDINSQTLCPQSTSAIRVTHRSGSNLITDVNISGTGSYQGACDGFICPPVHCALPVVPSLTRAQVTTAGNTLKILASAQRGSTPLGVGVKLTLTPNSQPNCGPR